MAADLGDDPPDVVMFVFDELPTVALLDGRGQIDAELYPNFARVAAMSTWYRNNTSVASFTMQAVPAILTGRLSSSSSADRADDENLFTLLAGSYEMHVQEQITRLCPDEVCPEATGGGLGPLLGDALDTLGRHDAPGRRRRAPPPRRARRTTGCPTPRRGRPASGRRPTVPSSGSTTCSCPTTRGWSATTAGRTSARASSRRAPRPAPTGPTAASPWASSATSSSCRRSTGSSARCSTSSRPTAASTTRCSS